MSQWHSLPRRVTDLPGDKPGAFSPTALQDGVSTSWFHRDFGTQLVLLAHLATALNSVWSGEGQASQARKRTVTMRVCVGTSEREPHCHGQDPQECPLQQSQGLSMAGAPCSALPLLFA